MDSISLPVGKDRSSVCRGWVGGWVGDRKVEENEAVRMSYWELGVWVGEVGGWVGG